MIVFGFNLSPADIWMLGICGSLIVILFGFSLFRYKSFCAAAAIFRSKVLTELEGLYPIPINWPKEKMMIDPLLRSKFPKLQSAVEEFKFCLPKRKRRSFTNAWVEYYSASGDDRCQGYYHYIPSISTTIINGKETTRDTTHSYNETFKQNVDNLLKYAKQK